MNTADHLGPATRSFRSKLSMSTSIPHPCLYPVPLRVNDAGRKLNSPDSNLGIGPVDCNHGFHTAIYGTFDNWRISFEKL